MPVTSWSTTASSNDVADAASGITWSEGMAPAQVNDSARAMMAVIKGDLANSLLTNGYQKLPNGLILQWGVKIASSDVVISYPIAFPSATFGVQATVLTADSGTNLYAVHVDSIGLSSYTARPRQVANGGSVSGPSLTWYWLAIGV